VQRLPHKADASFADTINLKERLLNKQASESVHFLLGIIIVGLGIATNASADSVTCVGSIGDEKSLSQSASPIKFAISTESKRVLINDSLMLPLAYALYVPQNQELTLITKSDTQMPKSSQWLERMKHFPITFKIGTRKIFYGDKFSASFYLGDGDFGWGGPIECTNWQNAIPSTGFDE
jgi:hypothetical protein